MDEEQFRKIQRQNRRLFIVLIVTVMILFTLLGLAYLNKTPTIIKNFVGQQGPKGDTTQVDYSAINTAIDSKVSSLPIPLNGALGPIGSPGPAGVSTIGPTGPTGPGSMVPGPASVVPGPKGAKGDKGQDGLTPIFQCDPITHNYEMQYTGAEDWTIIQADSKVCYPGKQ